MDHFDDLNSARFGLIKLEQIGDNGLLIHIASIKQTDKEDLIFEGVNLGQATQDFIDNTCLRYSIYFESCAAFQSLKEYYSCKIVDKYIGSTLRIYANSKYLNFVFETSIINFVWPGEATHYGIVCQSDIIDIIALKEPIITKLN
jgi:hypothetical protein